MTEQKLLTVREVSQILDISEREVLDLAENATLPAYKIGGEYLRFKRFQVEEFKKKSLNTKSHHLQNYTTGERISDFFYFNDFYIFSIILIALMLFVIFRL